MPQLSNRASSTPASPIRSLASLASAQEEKGKSVLRLNIGQPDVHSPKSFLEGIQSYKENVVSYEISEGNTSLREAWCSYMSETLLVPVVADDMLITVGASEALIFSFMVCCDPGDEILILDPTYANYIGFASVTGVKLVPVPTILEDGFSMPPLSQFESFITPKTKAVLICNPNNPTGTVYDKLELEAVLELCNKKDLFLILDETYREIVYDDRSPISILSIDQNSERVIMIDSLSKRFSLCGARIGCVTTKNQDVKQKLLNMAQARLAAPSIEQHAATYMLQNLEKDYFDTVRKTYESRRNILANELQKITDLVMYIPHGAFYAIARLPVESSEDFAKYLLNDFDINGETVFLSPAAGFYMEPERGRQKVRIAFVLEDQKLVRAVQIIDQALSQYRKI